MNVLVGIVGFRGYSGAEAIRILSHHPHCQPVLLEHRSDAGDEAKLLRKSPIDRLSATAGSIRANNIGAVLLCTPPEVSMDLVPQYLDTGAKVVDLSGAFRLATVERYTRWYKEPHTESKLLATAPYGLPEFYRDNLRGKTFVSNPGCYPTAANLALRPLVDAGILDSAAGVICDAKSGTSGAGRKASLKTSFCEVTENFSAYSVLQHRHVPEVLMNSGLNEADFSFTAQLLPLDRGILETIYFRTVAPMTAAEILAVYEAKYANEPFVRLYEAGNVPDLRAVQRTNFCDIGVIADPATRRCVVVSAIDNLGKGAAGQAIQNLNLMLDIEETAGLL